MTKRAIVLALGGLLIQVACAAGSSFVVSEGENWVRLDFRKGVQPDSALDFSSFGLQDAPAGKYGWTRAVGNHFEFENRPGIAQRFYGANVCSETCFLGDAEIEDLTDRFVRMGWNSVRIHHQDRHVAARLPDGRIGLDEAKMMRLDKLLSVCVKKGLYVTTDLYASRQVCWKDLGIDREGAIPGRIYKMLVMVDERAFADWAAFAEKFLTHVNPYTGRRWADEPALAFLDLLNENNWNISVDQFSKEPIFVAAWDKWLATKRTRNPDVYPEIKDGKMPTKSPWGFSSGNSSLARMGAEFERDFFLRAKKLLREKIGYRGLLTDQNWGPAPQQMNIVRATDFDFADAHCYIDHPYGVKGRKGWASRCSNENPVSSKSYRFDHVAFMRPYNKPFAVSEWNYCSPGEYRSVAGLQFGAFAALQDWDALWRFCYSSIVDDLADGNGFVRRFDMCVDPIGLLSDRAAVALFLRRDVERPFRSKTALVLDAEALDPARHPSSHFAAPRFAWDYLWRSQVGVAREGETPPGAAAIPFYAAYSGMRPADVIEDRAAGFSACRADGTLMVVAPRTVGAFAPTSGVSLVAGPLGVRFAGCGAAVWATSLTDKPLPESDRIVLFHLTDVQNEGATFDDLSRKIMTNLGKSPWLVRCGAADVSLDLVHPEEYDVWALATDGARLRKLSVKTDVGCLRFSPSVRCEFGACLVYEVVRRN